MIIVASTIASSSIASTGKGAMIAVAASRVASSVSVVTGAGAGGGGGRRVVAFSNNRSRRHRATTPPPITTRMRIATMMAVPLGHHPRRLSSFPSSRDALSSRSSSSCAGTTTTTTMAMGGVDGEVESTISATSSPSTASPDDDADGLLTDLSIAKGRWQNPRSRWARRRHRKRMERLNGVDGAGGNNGDDDGAGVSSLDWETFEFGTSPKMDRRFDDASENGPSPSDVTGIPNEVLSAIPSRSITYQSYVAHETDVDDITSAKSIESKLELYSLDPDLVRRAIGVLSPYVQHRRLERIDDVLSMRTRHARFLFENPSNPSNVYACLRTLDSFGIQYVDVVVTSSAYEGKAAMNQKRGMRTAMGSASWMTVRQFGSIHEAVRRLREEEGGCLIYASDLNPNARDVRDLAWDVDYDDDDDDDDDVVYDGGIGNAGSGRRGGQRPICIVMGNEERGISDEMRSLADETFYLPMCGFAESFNLSVATAITLAYMKAASGRGGDGVTTGDNAASTIDPGYGIIRGPLRPGDLDPHEVQCLKLRGVLNSLAQKRLGKILLDKEGITLPKSLYKD
jgi:tRNA G18 (ribose-2'-O)-methylase SpoU